jgi:hypothetical protein
MDDAPEWMDTFDMTDNDHIRAWATSPRSAMRQSPPEFQSADREKLRAAIERDAATVEHALRRIERNRAILSPIRKLPYEILVMIITHMGPFWSGSGFANRFHLLRLLGVCRTWRKSIFNTPSFFSYLSFGIDTFNTVEALKRWLDFSGNHPLHLAISSTDEIPLDSREYLRSLVSRITAIHFTHDTLYRFANHAQSGLDVFEEILANTSNHIALLTLHGVGDVHHILRGKTVLPHLKTLRSIVRWFPLPDLEAPMLQHVSLTSTNDNVLRDDILTSLSQLSAEMTSLSIMQVRVRGLGPPVHDVTFPKLARMTWTGVRGAHTVVDHHLVPRYIIRGSPALVYLRADQSIITHEIPPCLSLTDLVLVRETVNRGYRFSSENYILNSFRNLPNLRRIEVPLFNSTEPSLQDPSFAVMTTFASGELQKCCRYLETVRCHYQPPAENLQKRRYPDSEYQEENNDHIDQEQVRKQGRTMLGGIGVAIMTTSSKKKKGKPVVIFVSDTDASPWDQVTKQTLNRAQFKVVVDYMTQPIGKLQFPHINFAV